MIHSRKQIIENQSKFKEEIVDWLKKDFRNMKSELNSIDSPEQKILDEKNKLLEKLKKVKISSEVDRFFISERHICPLFYAWWDEFNNEVVKYKYHQQNI